MTHFPRWRHKNSKSSPLAPAKVNALGRSLSDFLPLLPGEQYLLEACRRGEVARLGTAVPEEATDACRVRADFLRFLLLGGDEQAPVHERGVQLMGAYIEGRLDLTGCRVPHKVSLKRCKFVEKLMGQDARVEGLITLAGSHLVQGFNADRLQCDGGLHLRDGFKSTGEVRLSGAQIDGSLSCKGAQFEVTAKNAFLADGVVVNGSLFLDEGFRAKGEVCMRRAQIRGNLSCNGGQFEATDGRAFVGDHMVVTGSAFLGNGFKALGAVRLLGARITGNLACRDAHFEVKEGFALSAENAIIEGAWFFDAPTQPLPVSVSHMQVGVLVDAPGSWAAGCLLDGFKYGALGGDAPTLAQTRLAWLRCQPPEHCGDTDHGAHFRPQPWRQLQRVLAEMGYAEDARQIGIEYERQMRKTGRIGRSPQGTPAMVAWGKRIVAQAAHATFGLLSGYGYRPMRLVGWMALIWLTFAIGYWSLALPPFSAIGPSDPLVYQNARYAACEPGNPAAIAAKASAVPYAGNWFLCEPLPPEYSTFSPLAYSLDIMLPFVDLGQEKSWGPLVPTPQAKVGNELLAVSYAHLVRGLVWFETLFGWVSSLLLAGIVSGFARRTEE